MPVQHVLPKIDLAPYVGEWVVICKDRVVAHHKNVAKLEKQIQNCKTTPTVTKIPKTETLIF